MPPNLPHHPRRPTTPAGGTPAIDRDGRSAGSNKCSRGVWACVPPRRRPSRCTPRTSHTARRWAGPAYTRLARSRCRYFRRCWCPGGRYRWRRCVHWRRRGGTASDGRWWCTSRPRSLSVPVPACTRRPRRSRSPRHHHHHRSQRRMTSWVAVLPPRTQWRFRRDSRTCRRTSSHRNKSVRVSSRESRGGKRASIHRGSRSPPPAVLVWSFRHRLRCGISPPCRPRVTGDGIGSVDALPRVGFVDS
mmetsp:Transcript_26607/g.30716  ORF Transcript_26607/g.30716 Transcript_26607/m.30716 type:complete len:246 (+) Transcript_26607:459-1196(+)